MSNLIVLDEPQLIDKLTVELMDQELIAVDTETTGVNKSAIVVGVSVCADEDTAYYIITHAWDGEVLHPLQDNIDAVKRLLNALNGKQLLMHNGLFDIEKIQSNYGINLIESLYVDTMLLTHLLDENQPVGLKPTAVRLFGKEASAESDDMKASVLSNGGEWTAANKEMYKADPYILGKYGAQDALLTYKIAMELLPKLYDEGLAMFFFEEESMPMLRTVTYELNTTGLKVDTQVLASLKKQLETECLEAKAFIYQEIKPQIIEKYPGTNKKNTFNIGAPQQLSWLLFGQLNLEFGTLTNAGKDVCKELGLRTPYTQVAKRDFIALAKQQAGQIKVPASIVNGKKKSASKFKEPWAYIAADKKTLIKLAPKYKWIETLLEYQRKTKLLNTYVDGIMERAQYGVIHPSFLQHGTTSGRYSSRNPNFQNLPRDDKRIKSCIVARSGKCFVGADYSQLEPRVFAYFSDDARLLAAFKSEDDFYSVIGMEVYEKHDCTPRKEGSNDAFGVKYKKLRDLSKVIALASTYGASAHQLASTTGKSIDDTQQDIDNYFEKFPGVAKMMVESHEMAKKDGRVLSLFGRPRRIPDALKINKIYGNKPHKELPYEARGLLNLAVNHRIQSTGASIMNRAAIRFCQLVKDAGIDAKLVLQVHDQIVAECNEENANDVALLMEEAMVNTVVLPTIALEAIPKIGKNLAEL